MTVAVINFYASDFSKEEFEDCAHDGIVVAAEGTVNLFWADFSAVEVAAELGLEEITWDFVRDSAPGDLTLTVHYPSLSLGQVERRFRGKDWIAGHEFQSPLMLCCYD